jgi:hypothetical protein
MRIAADFTGEKLMITNQDKNAATGLCMTCNHARCCVYLANASSSIWCCEEFDDRLPVIEEKANAAVEQPIEHLELKSRVA